MLFVNGVIDTIYQEQKEKLKNIPMRSGVAYNYNSTNSVSGSLAWVRIPPPQPIKTHTAIHTFQYSQSG